MVGRQSPKLVMVVQVHHLLPVIRRLGDVGHELSSKKAVSNELLITYQKKESVYVSYCSSTELNTNFMPDWFKAHTLICNSMSRSASHKDLDDYDKILIRKVLESSRQMIMELVPYEESDTSLLASKVDDPSPLGSGKTICSNCGIRISNVDLKFCSNCGAKFIK